MINVLLKVLMIWISIFPVKLVSAKHLVKINSFYSLIKIVYFNKFFIVWFNTVTTITVPHNMSIKWGI